MIEDPIYEIVRKRKLQDSFKTIVNGVSSTKRQIIEKDSIPYNTRHNVDVVKPICCSMLGPFPPSYLI